MTQALVTFIAPLALSALVETETAIEKLGNPASPALRTALDKTDGDAGTHFASLHAIKSVDGARAHIVFEFSADGSEAEALKRIVVAIGAELRSVFMLADDWRDGTDLGTYLTSHKVPVGVGWTGNPGLVFSGTPGMSVGRIRQEDALGRRVSALVEAQAGGLSALERITDVRQAIAEDLTLAAMLQPATPAPPFKPLPTPSLVTQIAFSFIATYLAPVIFVVIAVAVVVGIRKAWEQDGFWDGFWAFLGGLITTLWGGFWIALLFVIGVALILYVQLRKAEASDFIDTHVAGPLTNTAMFANENVAAQNHMISITQLKPGLIRFVTIRLIFWIIGQLATSLYPPGFLSQIGTIHFARWVTAPGTPDLIFLSNYGGSWESYLEDFITRAHAGLTGVWSNTLGFPKSENLFQLGATDGDRFKRFARHSMIPTRFWYCAYPTLVTATIRSNAQICAGLSGVMTEDEARRWLALFGSDARPASKLVATDIQSIIFGGLGFMPFATCLIYDLPETGARDWLRALQPHIAYNDGRRLGADAVASLALGARGLKRLGLPAEGLATFPFAFIAGMTTDYRAKILGDVGANARDQWRWGREQSDVSLMVYARSAEAAADLETTLDALAKTQGLALVYRVAMKPVTQNKAEPFGFVDGISQPVIRGTYKALRNADSIHIVEPGEFILGYPDNRGYIPPSPMMSALMDPENRLPLQCSVDAGFSRTVVEDVRDIGFNGSFLVIRELEQDVAGFDAYCEREAQRLQERLPPPYAMTKDFVGAKLLGRWKDGSSLVRHPYESQTDRHRKVDEHVAAAKALSKEMVGNKQLVVESAAPMTRPESTTTGGAETVQAAPQKAFVAADPGVPAKPSYADNDFLFGAEDPEALNCPYGAHIRRGNPRDSLDPGSKDQIAISNRHRIMRIGRQYEPQPGQNPGLFFMCLNGDIERQFEFLQQTWLRSPSFHGLSCEKDPVLGDAEDGNCGFTIPSRYGPARLSPMPRFVTTKGGGYFFLPGKRLIDYLCGLP